MQYLVLGPVLVESPAGPIKPGGPTTRAVLCSLLLAPNRAVPADRISYDVWGENGPGPHALQSHMTRLRSHLGADSIVSEEGSYRLVADAEKIDARRFERLIDEAMAQDDAAATRRLYLEAFDLWRGVPFGDLADRDFLALEVGRLEDVRLRGVEMCIEADLELGRHREIIGSLRAAVTEFPYHEKMWGYLMRALEAGGRQPEALEVYGELERFLNAELDIEPNKELQALRREMASS